MAILNGSADGDDLHGTIGNDTFFMEDGGVDTVAGAAGDDQFFFADGLTADDRINGGAGSDEVLLSGDYSAGLVFADDTIRNIELIDLSSGVFNLKFAAGNVAAGEQLQVNLRGDVTLDGTALTDSGLLAILQDVGDRIVTGGAGSDGVLVFSPINRTDRFHLGGGFDTVEFDSAPHLVTRAGTLTGVDKLQFDNGGSVVLHDGNIAAGAALLVDGLSSSAGLTCNAHREMDGSLAMTGSLTGADRLVGGHMDDDLAGFGGADTLTGGDGADTLNGGLGNDIFVYNLVSDSTRRGFDVIEDLTNTDRIALNMDADLTTAGHQSFTLVAALDGHAGQLALSYNAHRDVTKLMGDVDGDGKPDFYVELKGDHTDFTGFVVAA